MTSGRYSSTCLSRPSRLKRHRGHRAKAEVAASRYLLVELANRTCGFALATVAHVHSERQVVRAPKTADSLAVGVTAIGGRVLPVLDLAARLRLPAKAPKPNFVELYYPEGGTFVIAVERIAGIATIAQEALSRPSGLAAQSLP